MSTPNLRTARSNRILAALPRDALEKIIPDLAIKSLAMRETLQKRRTVPPSVVFPISGVASMISTGDSGKSVEVATIGSEGIVGLPLFLGGKGASAEIFMQVPGEGLCMPAAQFKRHVQGSPALVRTLLLYTQALLTQVAQTSACMSYHSVSARCARWLLQTHDRVGADEFPLTHEFLGLMLGVRRATVSEAAEALQSRGLIRYRRGVINVLNRLGLEKAACECYTLIRREYDELLKPRRV